MNLFVKFWLQGTQHFSTARTWHSTYVSLHIKFGVSSPKKLMNDKHNPERSAKRLVWVRNIHANTVRGLGIGQALDSGTPVLQEFVDFDASREQSPQRKEKGEQAIHPPWKIDTLRWQPH